MKDYKVDLDRSLAETGLERPDKIVPDMPTFSAPSGVSLGANVGGMGIFDVTYNEDRVVTGNGKIDEALGPLGSNQNPAVVIPDEYSFFETMKASFKLENSLGSTYAYGQNKFFEDDPYFDATKDKRAMDNYQEFFGEWIHAQSKDELEHILAKIDDQKEMQKILSTNMGSGLLTTMAAATLDPVFLPFMLVPMASVAKGGSALNNAVRWGGMGAGAEVLAEEIKRDAQATRTLEDSAINIIAAGTLSALLGAGASQLTKAQFNKTSDDVYQYVTDPYKFIGPLPEKQYAETLKDITGSHKAGAEFNRLSAGAAKASDSASADDFKLLGAGFFEKLPLNPLIRLANSPIGTARKLSLWLADSPYYYKGYLDGKNLGGDLGTIESRQKQYMARHFDSVQNMERMFMNYRKQNDSKVAASKVSFQDMSGKSNKEGFMTYNQFKEQVSRAIRRNGKHDVPEVAEAANYIRQNVFEWTRQQAKEAGEDWGESSAGYLMRMYDVDKIAGESFDTPNGFSQRIYNWFVGEQSKYQLKTDHIGKHMEALDFEHQVQSGDIHTFQQYDANLTQRAKDYKNNILNWDIDVNDPVQVQRALKMDYKPKSIGAYLRDKGGIRDDRGEFKAMDIHNKSYVGLFSKNGMAEDDMMLSLQEGGYLPLGLDAKSASIDDVLDLIARDIDGDRVYSSAIMEQLEEINYVQHDLNEMLEYGLKRNSSVKQIKEYLQQKDGRTYDIPAEIKRRKENLKSINEQRLLRQKELDEMSPFANLTKQELRNITMNVVDNIKNMAKGTFDEDVLPDHMAFKTGPMQGRRLTISDLEIEDYLISDVERITKNYTRSVGTQIELSRDFGDVNLSEPLADINRQYNTLRNTTEKAMREEGKTSEEISKALNKLQKQQGRDIDDLLALRDKLLGKYNLPQDPNGFWIRLSDFVKRANFTRLLGGMTISALPDLARPIMTQGFKPVYNSLRAMIKDSNFKEMSERELKMMGIGWETYSNARMHSWADLTDDILYRSKIERGMEKFSEGFARMTLMPAWNDALKSVSGVAVMDGMIRAIIANADGVANPRQVRELAKLGFDKDQSIYFSKLLKEHGKEGDAWLPNTELWGDTEAVMKFRASVAGEVDRVIVTPSIGEMPLWVSKPVANHIMQFKSFGLSAHSKVLMAGLQARDGAALSGFLLGTSIGSMVYSIKQLSSGRDITDNTGDFLYESIDRAGMLGWLNEPLQTASKLTGGQLSLGRLWGSEQASLSRYQSRNMLGLLGPTTDFVGDMASVSRSVATGEVSQGDVKAARRLLPLQNLFYLRWLFDNMQEEAALNVVNQ